MKNESTTLEPSIQLFNADKASLGAQQNKTQGGDAAYTFVSLPDTRYIVRIGSHYQTNIGVYLVRAHAQKAYDAHEPNEDILRAKTASLGTGVEAKIMDSLDVDVFKFEGLAEKDVTISLQNKSTTLHPYMVFYNGEKSKIGEKSNKTPGGDAKHTFKSTSDVLYVRVADHYRTNPGEYVLKVEAK